MASMMDEMAKTLARRRAAVEKKQPEQPPVRFKRDHLSTANVTLPHPPRSLHFPITSQESSLLFYHERPRSILLGTRKFARQEVLGQERFVEQ